MRLPIRTQHVTVAGKAVTFKLDSQDDQAAPKVGVQVAQNLVDHNVAAVIGPLQATGRNHGRIRGQVIR